MKTAGVVMMVGEWFARYVAGKVRDKMTEEAFSSCADDRNVLGDVRAMLKRVEERLPGVHAVIHAAEGRPIRDTSLALWLAELKDAAYEADDMLDEFELKELRSRHLHDSSKVTALASSALRFLKNLFVTDDELRRLGKLVGDLDDICLDIDRKKAELDEYNGKDNSATRETSSFLHDEVIGRDEERNKILDILLSSAHDPDFGDKRAGSSSHPSLGVLPIVGMGGVGKTTLAQLVYNDQLVADHFELRRWVYVSDDFNLRKIVKELVYDMAFDPLFDDICSGEIQAKLQDATRNVRFLFVLDDVWDETGSKWKQLRDALVSGARGSTILVTTQSPLVAETMGTMEPIKLEVLGQDDFWRLFERCAFGDKVLDPDLARKLELIGREISGKLHGLPLAGKAMGSLLRRRLEEQFWTTISESEWWEDDFAVENILPSLGLSYQHLSTNLKQCFAYTSIFPKGHVFDKERLVQMWIAQGFIHPKSEGRTRPEDLGSQMFDELTNRYFFLPTLNNKHVMHDLMRDLAVYVSWDECFVVDDEPAEIPPTVRHLALRTTKLDAVRGVCKFRKLRTIILLNEYDSEDFYHVLEDMLENLKSLRVLDLSNVRMGKKKKLPDAICDLPHLRFLDLSCTKTRHLPKSFSRICHLQVLNLNSCRFKKMAEGMNRLIKLRHLYADAETISLIDGIGKLTELQELAEFRVARKRGHHIGELKELRNLRRRLTIQNLENVETKDEAMEAKLKDKSHLDSLWLNRKPDMHSPGDREKEILEGLEPHCNLKELRIQHYGGTTSPDWLVRNQHLTNLESLYLNNCARCESLPPLGQLPFLKLLHLMSMPVKRIGAEFYGDAEQAFPSLETLKFESLKEWEEWAEADGRQFLGRLRVLHLYDCPRLRKAPLLYLTSSPLAELSLKHCGDLGSALPGCLQTLSSLNQLELYHYAHRTEICLSNLSELRELHLYHCPELSLLGGLRSLANMRHMETEGCPKLYETSQPGQRYGERELRSLCHLQTDENLIDNVWFTLGRISSLRNLALHRCGDLVSFTVEQEEWFQQLTSLEHLQFLNCPNLQALPTSLVTVSSIKKLSIGNCPKISSLPESGVPMSVKEVRIWGCPSLSDRCRKDRGPDWPKIDHIPRVCIDDEIIQMM
ncbi:disease resistance protein RGA2 [Musa acuminata AAA Group]|uniref:disease resistance protein RGA2 n=1 Tax=Musa acuminata AAA Group TaxID=214697 RepID=UPI0031DD5187